MAKTKKKKGSNKLMIFNYYTSFQSPDNKIIRKEISKKKLFPD